MSKKNAGTITVNGKEFEVDLETTDTYFDNAELINCVYVSHFADYSEKHEECQTYFQYCANIDETDQVVNRTLIFDGEPLSDVGGPTLGAKVNGRQLSQKQKAKWVTDITNTFTEFMTTDNFKAALKHRRALDRKSTRRETLSEIKECEAKLTVLRASL